MENNAQWLIAMKNNLLEQGKLNLGDSFAQRTAGLEFVLTDHIRAMLHSLLSNQIDWGRVQPLLSEIDLQFYNYDITRLKNSDPKDLANIISNFGLNAVIDRTKQMQGFLENISVFEKIENSYPMGLDNFVTGQIICVVSEFSGNIIRDKKGTILYKPCQTSLGNIKLKQMGVPLVCEYLKNVGISTIKSDTHVSRFYKRFYGMNALQYKPYIQDKEYRAFFQDVFDYANRDSILSGIPVGEIDAIIWSYCANSGVKVCSKESPRCNECVVSQWCKRDFS